MKQKLVSVIIPTYNRAYSVADAIRSVQNQTYAAVQIIVVDDGSKDETPEIIAQFEDIEYYHQENRGQGAARNLGLRYAKGEYIASLDSDDVWKPEFLSEGVKNLEKYDLDFVFLNWTSSNGKESTLDFWNRLGKWSKFGIVELDGEWLMFDSGSLRRLFLLGCPAPTSSFIMRRSSFNLWNEEVIAADDWVLILEMVVSKPCRAAFTLSPFWTKRVFNDNIYDGRDVSEITENHVYDDRVMKRLLYSCLEFKEKQIFRKRTACNIFDLARRHWACGGISKKVIFTAAKAVALAPIGVSSYIAQRLLANLTDGVNTSVHEKPRADEQKS